MSVTFKVEGLKDLEAELARISKAAGKGALRRAGVQALGPMADIARQRAPRDTEALANSIAVSARAKGAGADVGKAQFAATLRGGGSQIGRAHV